MDPLEPNARTCPSTKQHITAVNKVAQNSKENSLYQRMSWGKFRSRSTII